MKEQFKTPSRTKPNPIDNTVRETVASYMKQKHAKTIFFSPTEVWNKIRKLSSKKAPGPDGITNSTLKHSGNKTIIKLSHIYNGCIREEYLPEAWKSALLIMIPKPGNDPKDPTNHRPISFLNTMTMVFESVILDRLKLWTKTRPEQHGFRTQHITMAQLIDVIDHITNNMNKRQKTAAALLDIQKAFDKFGRRG